MIEIPKQLQRDEFRFCLLVKKLKKPFENNWQSTNNYKYNDEKLLNWIEADNNYGVIGGYGNLVIIDIDDENLANEMIKKLNTFTVRTGGGGCHLYVISNYKKNHVFINELGELRANNYQVVGANSIHPTGEIYKVINESEIMLLPKEELMRLITPLTVDLELTIEEQENVDKDYLDKNILPKIKDNFIFSLITQSKTPEELKHTGFPSRSERDGRIVVSLLLAGLGNYIKSIFKIYPCGDKFREHSSPSKYIEHQIKNARIYSGVMNDYVINVENEMENLNDKIVKNKVDYFLRKILDIDDWFLRAGLITQLSCRTRTRRDILEKRLSEIIASSKRVNAIELLDMLKKDIKEHEYWIFPLIPKNALIIFGGKPQSFKSLLALSMSLFIKSNRKFLDTFEISTTPPKILYYDLENGEDSQVRRAQYIINGNELVQENLDDFKFKYDFDKHNLEKELIFAKDYDVVILDSYRRFLDGSEDKSEVTDKFFTNFLFRLREAKKTVIIIHHMRKQKMETQDESEILDSFRGSGDITAQLDIAYGIFRTEEEILVDGNKELVKFNVIVQKAKVRGTYPIKNFTFTVLRDDENKKALLSFAGYRKNISPKERRQSCIINFVKIKREANREEIHEHVKNTYSCSEASVDRDLKEMLAKNEISQPRYGIYVCASV